MPAWQPGSTHLEKDSTAAGSVVAARLSQPLHVRRRKGAKSRTLASVTEEQPLMLRSVRLVSAVVNCRAGVGGREGFSASVRVSA